MKIVAKISSSLLVCDLKVALETGAKTKQNKTKQNKPKKIAA